MAHTRRSRTGERALHIDKPFLARWTRNSSWTWKKVKSVCLWVPKPWTDGTGGDYSAQLHLEGCWGPSGRAMQRGKPSSEIHPKQGDVSSSRLGGRDMDGFGSDL